MTVARSLRGLRSNSVVIMTALVALLAMHGLSSDHAMGVPSVHMTMASGHAVDHEQGSVTAPVTMGSEMTTATPVVVSMTHQMGHAGGMCVGILGAALLLWLFVRSAGHRLSAFGTALCLLVRTFPARDGPPTGRLCPSPVQLCILRT